MQDNTIKDKILMAALDLFSKKGMSATGIDEIAESIGMKGPNIYKYFKGKEAIFNELCKFDDTEYSSRMLMDSPFPKFIHTPEELKIYCLRQIEFTVNNDIVAKFRKMHAIEQFRNKEMAALATKYQYENVVVLYKEIFSNMMKNGELDEGNPEMMALQFTAPITLLLQLNDRVPEKKDEIMKKIEEHLDYFIEKNFNK